jgi:biopolymer transport protein ExbB/TolQ
VIFLVSFPIYPIIYFFVFKKRNQSIIDGLSGQISKKMEDGDFESALKLCNNKPGMALAHVLKGGLQDADKGVEKIQNSIDEANLEVVPDLEKRTSYLATLGNIATLIGLMGTIWGLIISFKAVGQPGIDPAKKSEMLAQGISTAMHTTLSGLLIAIPSLLLYAIFTGKTTELVDTIDEQAIKLVNTLIEKSYKTKKYHISAREIKEGIGMHITRNNVKIFTDNKLIKEFNV